MKKTLQLITEYNNPINIPKNFEVFREEVTIAEGETQQRLKFKGPFLKTNTKNKNRRVYPRGVLREAVDEYDQQFIQDRGAYGELGHPDSVNINLENACHITETIQWDGDVGYGQAEVLENTPKGELLSNLLERQCRVGVSTRGLGDLKPVNEGEYNEVTSYKLIAVDVVANPSTPDAFVDGILESKEFILEKNGEIKEVEKKYNQFEEKLKQLPTNKREKILREAVTEFLNSI